MLVSGSKSYNSFLSKPDLFDLLTRFAILMRTVTVYGRKFICFMSEDGKNLHVIIKCFHLLISVTTLRVHMTNAPFFFFTNCITLGVTCTKYEQFGHILFIYNLMRIQILLKIQCKNNNVSQIILI